MQEQFVHESRESRGGLQSPFCAKPSPKDRGAEGEEELQAEQFWTGQCDPPSPEQATAASMLPGLKGQREGGEGARLCGGESGGEGATPEFHTVGLKRQALSCLFNHGKPRPSGHPKTLSARSPCPGLIGPPEAEVTTSMV